MPILSIRTFSTNFSLFLDRNTQLIMHLQNNWLFYWQYGVSMWSLYYPKKKLLIQQIILSFCWNCIIMDWEAKPMNGSNLTFITENSLCVIMVMILNYLQLVVFLKDLFLGLCYSCYMLMTYLTHQVLLVFTYLLMTITSIIIRCVFFFPSIGRESTTWPANNCLQIMVCSCVVPSKCVLLQIILCSCVIGTTFWREKWSIASLSC